VGYWVVYRRNFPIAFSVARDLVPFCVPAGTVENLVQDAAITGGMEQPQLVSNHQRNRGGIGFTFHTQGGAVRHGIIADRPDLDWGLHTTTNIEARAKYIEFAFEIDPAGIGLIEISVAWSNWWRRITD
jgi:hypothetical protein